MPLSSSREPIDLQPRDFTFLRGLFESRVMTLTHAAALHFDGRQEAAKKRVQKLKSAGYVRERPRRVYEPSVLSLTAKAFSVLADAGRLQDYPRIGSAVFERRAHVSPLTIAHELDVMDVKVAVTSAMSRLPGFQIVEFSTWPLLFQFKACRPDEGGFGQPEVTVKPDGFIRVYEQDGDGLFEHAFFLELDRSTESQEVLALKAACYVDYYRNGGFAVRQGGDRSQYQSYPFRVLMVFRNAERRNNAAERLLLNNPPIHRQVWLTTVAEVTADPLGPIWVQPVDYRTVIQGTPFDPQRRSQSDPYRRRPEREQMVEHHIAKRRLLSE